MGGLDGTYIKIRVPFASKTRYKTRKDKIAINVLGASTPNMQYTYVLPSLEGSGTDGRVLIDALNRENGLKVTNGE